MVLSEFRIHLNLRYIVGFRFGKKHFLKMVKGLVAVLSKTTLFFMNLPFIHKKSITLSLLKIVTLKFTMYILTVLAYSLKLYIIEKKDLLQPRLL